MSKIRDLVFRVLFDPDFATTLSQHPDRALEEYDLGEEERAALERPAFELFRLLAPGSGENQWGDWHRPPPTITAGHVFTTPAEGDFERLGVILSGIRATSGSARYALVRALVGELTRER